MPAHQQSNYPKSAKIFVTVSALQYSLNLWALLIEYQANHNGKSDFAGLGALFPYALIILLAPVSIFSLIVLLTKHLKNSKAITLGLIGMLFIVAGLLTRKFFIPDKCGDWQKVDGVSTAEGCYPHL